MVDSNRDSKFPMLVKQVKALNFESIIDSNMIMSLSKSIFAEWERTRAKYKNETINGYKFNKKLFAKYEAEEEILIGLLFCLHEKTIEFIINEQSR